jgi:hypothetical protein
MEGTGETDSPAEEDRFEPSVPLTGYAGLFRERARCQKVERVVSNRCSILAGLTVRIRIPPVMLRIMDQPAPAEARLQKGPS